MGWSSSPISALGVLHHRGSQQGIQTDSWEICAGVQLDLDERKNTHCSEKQWWIQNMNRLT
jgi:hypothetical protein